MAKTTAKYELMYIIDPDIGEDGTAAMVEKFKALIGKSGTVDEHKEIGKQRLAYLINDKPEGYYVLVRFTSGPEFPGELSRVLKITDGVMRSLITVVGEHGDAGGDGGFAAEDDDETGDTTGEGTAEETAAPPEVADAEEPTVEVAAQTDPETKEE
jgi:small subunit ribosomal protein S6